MLRIQPYSFNQNSKVVKRNFKSTTSPSAPKQQKTPNPPRRSSVSNYIYWGMLANTLVATPIMQNHFENEIDKEYAKFQTDDQTRLLYNEINNKAKIDGKTSTAFYNLRKFQEVEMPKMKKLSKDLYQADFEMNNQQIAMTLSTKDLNKEKLSGTITVNIAGKELEKFDYKADFSGDDIKKFNFELISKNDSSVTKHSYERSAYGDLYLIDQKTNKKTIVNKESKEKYDYKQFLTDARIDTDRAFRESQKTNYMFCLLLTLFMLATEPKGPKKQ